MRMPDLLSTRWGRLVTFFFLYLTEGIPLGFVAVSVAAELRSQGVGPADIGGFIALFYIPWSFKFAVGPVVDVFYSDRFGRRRTWILAMQGFMVVTLLMTMGAQLPGELKLFSVILFVHNIFAATQDVAIDALAVNVLSENERGVANGVMFGGAYLGQAVGGSAVLFMMDGGLSLGGATVFVAAVIASVTILIVLPMRERAEPRADEGVETRTRWERVGGDVKRFLLETWRSIALTRDGRLGLLLALLPAGALGLGLALSTNLAVELGFDKGQLGTLNLWSTVLSAVGCVVGGLLSDKFGRKRSLAIYVILMAIPTLFFAWRMQTEGWIMPIDTTAEDRPMPAAILVTSFWIAALVYALFNGLMYGTRSALFMDITNPAVAATQFTAYMALCNLTIAYSAKWQGWAAEAYGYPATLTADAIFGCACLFVLYLIRPVHREPRPGPMDA